MCVRQYDGAHGGGEGECECKGGEEEEGQAGLKKC